jgi:hypothetical protein
LKARLLLNTELLGEVEVDSDQLSRLAYAEVPPDKTWIVATTVLITSFLVIPSPSELCVEAETERGPLIPARLNIKPFPPNFGAIGMVQMDVAPSPRGDSSSAE